MEQLARTRPLVLIHYCQTEAHPEKWSLIGCRVSRHFPVSASYNRRPTETPPPHLFMFSADSYAERPSDTQRGVRPGDLIQPDWLLKY